MNKDVVSINCSIVDVTYSDDIATLSIISEHGSELTLWMPCKATEANWIFREKFKNAKWIIEFLPGGEIKKLTRDNCFIQ